MAMLASPFPAPVEVLCAGIIVADHVSSPISHLPAPGELVLADQLLLTIGGCAANVAVGLVKLGVRAGVLGCVGEDIFGRVVADLLRERGVEVSELQIRPSLDTSQTLIVNVRGQDRRFIHTFGANAAFSARDLQTSLKSLQRAASMPAALPKALYLGGYLLMDQVDPHELAEVFREAQQLGLRTILDVVTPAHGTADDFQRRLKPVLPHTDVFLPNDHEAKVITGIEDSLAQAEHFHAQGAQTVIITQGERGSILVSKNLRLRAGVYPMPFVDGTGGGDAFTAGYLAGLLQGLPVVGCLQMASAVGASCVRAVGTTTGVFTAEECAAFLAKHELTVQVEK